MDSFDVSADGGVLCHSATRRKASADGMLLLKGPKTYPVIRTVPTAMFACVFQRSVGVGNAGGEVALYIRGHEKRRPGWGNFEWRLVPPAATIYSEKIISSSYPSGGPSLTTVQHVTRGARNKKPNIAKYCTNIVTNSGKKASKNTKFHSQLVPSDQKYLSQDMTCSGLMLFGAINASHYRRQEFKARSESDSPRKEELEELEEQLPDITPRRESRTGVPLNSLLISDNLTQIIVIYLERPHSIFIICHSQLRNLSVRKGNITYIEFSVFSLCTPHPRHRFLYLPDVLVA